jgi:hypothetical protein
MKKEEIYSEWIRRRQSVSGPEDLEERVMAGIAKLAAVKRPVPSGLYRVLTSRPVQWAAAAGALLLGLLRLSYVTYALLIP